jgi:hypothetical protein
MRTEDNQGRGVDTDSSADLLRLVVWIPESSGLSIWVGVGTADEFGGGV